MLKICLTLVLTVSLSCLAEPQRGRLTVMQRDVGASRSSDDFNEMRRFDPRSQYPTTARPVESNVFSSSPKSFEYNRRHGKQNQYSIKQRTVNNPYYNNQRQDDNRYTTNQRTDNHYYDNQRDLDDNQYQINQKAIDNEYQRAINDNNYQNNYNQYSTSKPNSGRFNYANSPKSDEDYNPTSQRTVEISSPYPTYSSTLDDSEYPTSPRAVESEPNRNKYRRKPKQTHYPKVVSFYQKPSTNNGYEFKYITADGVQRAERGYLSDKGVWTVEGSVTSLDNDNVVVQSYIADGSGYKSSVRKHSADKFRSLDDYISWISGHNNKVQPRMGDPTIASLIGGY